MKHTVENSLEKRQTDEQRQIRIHISHLTVE